MTHEQLRLLVSLGSCACACYLPDARSDRNTTRRRLRSTPAPNYKESTVNFQNTEGWKVASPQDAMLRGKWWEVFNDPELNALEDQLEINNQNIKQYFQNFMEARRWWLRRARSIGRRSPRARHGIAPSPPAISPIQLWQITGQTSTVVSAPIDVAWTPDFFGKIRNQVREEQYAAQVSAADLEVERLTEETSLAQYYFEIRGQDALEQILQETVAADQKLLDLTQSLYDTGIDDYYLRGCGSSHARRRAG